LAGVYEENDAAKVKKKIVYPSKKRLFFGKKKSPTFFFSSPHFLKSKNFLIFTPVLHPKKPHENEKDNADA
jgi:hypothetical protein